ncbi:MAG: methionine biosynthesis protein MetW [Candidatus Competibacteraceae bacterium]|nr:methionine biosynthesis protein MetW [Candidatus Competibacteraceae bacterium]
MRPELEIISEWIRPGARVLDLGCGDGTLLAHLQAHRRVGGYGLEIDPHKIVRCIESGVAVLQADLEAGLAGFEDNSFDYVLMTQTLQAVQHTERLLDEMLRVGRQGIVTFPNFGFWRCRVQLALGGYMPVVKSLPHEWYNTPNIHLFTIRDFDELCRRKNVDILQRTVMDSTHRSSWLERLLPNLLGELALYRLGRA